MFSNVFSIIITRTSSVNDTTAPIATIEQPASNISTEANAFLVSGSASDSSAVASLSVNGVNATSSNNFADWQANVALAVGANTITVAVSDSLGNSDNNADSVVITRTVPQTDTTAPSATIDDRLWRYSDYRADS